MKFNLKNRPRGMELYPHKAEEWFEGFEKELRFILEHYREYQQKPLVVYVLKEILGE